MSEETVVERGRSRYGVHHVHVVRAGKPVEREKWMVEAPDDADQYEVYEYSEAELGIFHLHLWWKEKGARCYEWIR